ncbi:hypothetical protein WJT74_05920 [Sphingomicrobium sp. XHP0239]|uniref:hypothetical protein n=1 Tax=Sphingomicrobium maritimum TaxID=3133972 RepID=UPI0031CCAC4A
MSMWENVIIANIGWSEDYGGTPVKSSHGYVRDHGTGVEAFNFKPHEGRYYAYLRSTESLANKTDQKWTVFLVSKPDDRSRLRLVGWYEGASIVPYEVRKEYDGDPSFPTIKGADRYKFSLVSEHAALIPLDEREKFQLPVGHRIGSTGIYYVNGGNAKDSEDKKLSRRKMLDWLQKQVSISEAASWADDPDKLATPNHSKLKIDSGGKPYGYDPRGESDAHRNLKEWVKNNPEFVTGEPHCIEAEPEFRLDSADVADVLLETADTLWLVEVKPRFCGDPEHYRGIFQCVKYRAVSEAMPSLKGKLIEVALVTEDPLKEDHRRLIEELEITHKCAPQDRK